MRLDWRHWGLLAALFMAAVLSQFASKEPDGLERIAADLGFLKRSDGANIINSTMAGYAVPGIGSDWLSSSLAAAFGVVILYVALTYLGKYMRSNGQGN